MDAFTYLKVVKIWLGDNQMRLTKQSFWHIFVIFLNNADAL